MSQSLTEFAALLGAAQYSALHLEMRDHYAMGNEQEAFAAWRDGERLDPEDRASWWRPWLDVVAEATGRGVAMRRARIVSAPPSEYSRYLYDMTFTNVSAGEEIRWLNRRHASDLALPGNDFWLFDDRIVQFNVFDAQGAWVHTDESDDPVTAGLCATAFKAVWERAIPHGQYPI
ncbi:DUF6879 family protein [Streptomyces sp. NPDC050085]|uniref:DUF6879 family protein n=1 Tax=Streptomyces sp. NPDC050085 TaxID=3365600 RepID=UPI0037BC0CC5